MSEARLNLLVVDWDFFFPNPSYSAVIGEEAMLYLWDHKEAPAYLGPLVWSGRASSFIRNGMELPYAQGYERFWDRFNFNPDGVSVLYGDSNLWAGKIMPSTMGLDEEYETADAWARVSLWDAHHDCGYPGTGTLEEWRQRGTVSCEDWMLVHHDAGSALDVTYPGWRVKVGQVEPEPLVPVDRRVDDGTDPDLEYHAVYVCRSGAWVPPWCDNQFTEFLAQAPDSYPMLMDYESWVHPRPDGVAEAHQTVRAADLFDQVTAGGGIDPAVVEELRRQRQGGAS